MHLECCQNALRNKKQFSLSILFPTHRKLSCLSEPKKISRVQIPASTITQNKKHSRDMEHYKYKGYKNSTKDINRRYRNNIMFGETYSRLYIVG